MAFAVVAVVSLIKSSRNIPEKLLLKRNVNDEWVISTRITRYAKNLFWLLVICVFMAFNRLTCLSFLLLLLSVLLLNEI